MYLWSNLQDNQRSILMLREEINQPGVTYSPMKFFLDGKRKKSGHPDGVWPAGVTVYKRLSANKVSTSLCSEDSMLVMWRCAFAYNNWYWKHILVELWFVVE